ncbi:hypothetical protein IAD21_06058 [Abditibacteriota bacterium]|nr:hypothetical protein IAD21_06058 [Abditibacteriota bacterium]
MAIKSEFKTFLTEYSKALDDRDAGIFVGAGLSMPAGFKSWPELLRDVAEDIGLKVDRETDLVALAQYHVNEKKVRSRLNQLLVDEFNQDVSLTENHHLLASLPIETVWTTNYDKLLERAFKNVGKRVDAKVTTHNFSTTVRGRDVTIYKMHGDVSQPEAAVLTKEDYELFSVNREIYSTALRGDLVSKTLLFLGFSFTDANVDFILSRIRVLLGANPRQHYCIMKRPQYKGSGRKKAEYDYEKRKLELRVSDLKRYGIEALLIDDYSEITEILKELGRRTHRRNVFLSGSAHDYAPLGQPRIEGLTRLLGQQLIKNGFNLVSGFGLGIASACLTGAMEEIYSDEGAYLNDRVVLRPFPQGISDPQERDALYSKYRNEMLSRVGATIFIAGNRQTNVRPGSEVAPGVLEEFAILKQQRKYPIPIGATGSAAKQIWDEVVSSLKAFYPSEGVKAHFETLGNPNKTDEEIVAAVISILKQISK